MPPPSISHLFKVGIDVMKTVVNATTKTILAQLGKNDTLNPTAQSDSAEWWQHVGFISRPSKPIAGQASCQGIAINRGDHDCVIASKDLRGQALAGTILDGETCIYAPGDTGTGQARILLKANGNVGIFTLHGNTTGGLPVVIQANATDGSVQMANEYGAISIASDGIKMMFGAAGIQIDANGVTLIGQNLALNGGAVSIGANAILPAVVGPAGISGVGSTSVKIAL